MIFVPPQIIPRPRTQLSSYVIDSIELAGVAVPPSSRLRRMHELYHSGIGTIGQDHPLYEMAIEGDRDMQLLGFVFDQCGSTELSDEFRRLLGKLVCDSVLPQEDRTNSPGRDAGFELYVGAVCTAAQLLPVRWEEPDVSCVWKGVKYGFAAKRIKNIKNLLVRIRKAASQIDRSGLPGLIVLDVSLAFNPDNLRIRQMPDTVFYSEYLENFQATWSEYQPKVQRIMARADVLGIIVHDYHIRQQTDGWQLAGMTIRVAAEGRTVEEQRHFDELSTLYKYGLVNQDDGSSVLIDLPGTSFDS